MNDAIDKPTEKVKVQDDDEGTEPTWYRILNVGATLLLVAAIIWAIGQFAFARVYILHEQCGVLEAYQELNRADWEQYRKQGQIRLLDKTMGGFEDLLAKVPTDDTQPSYNET